MAETISSSLTVTTPLRCVLSTGQVRSPTLILVRKGTRGEKGRKERRKEGKKEGREEGRKGGRKEGRKEEGRKEEGRIESSDSNTL